MISRSIDEHLVSLIDIQCRSISYSNDTSLKEDLVDITAELKQKIDPQVVDVVLEMNGRLRDGLILERYADRKNPLVFAANLYNKTWTIAKEEQEAAGKIRDEKLRPLLGDRADEVFTVCFHKAWAEQNSEDYENAVSDRITGSRWGYKDDAIHDDSFARYYTKFMGFSTYPEISKNVAIKLLCFYRARYWTAQKVTGTHSWADYGPRSRQADFEIADLRSKAVCQDDDFVNAVCSMAEQCRAAAHWNRNDSRNALSRVTELLFFWTQQEEQDPEVVHAEAEKTRERIRRCWPKEGAKADLLFELCEHCAWHEQNQVDYDHCLIGKASGAADGYKEDADKMFHEIQLTSYRLGLD